MWRVLNRPGVGHYYHQTRISLSRGHDLARVYLFIPVESSQTGQIIVPAYRSIQDCLKHNQVIRRNEMAGFHSLDSMMIMVMIITLDENQQTSLRVFTFDLAVCGCK